MKLCTHHHYGWRDHSAGNMDDAALLVALIDTHDFLKEFEGKYRVEIERTPAYSYDGNVRVYWEAEERHQMWGCSLGKGDYWFRAFEFNFADDFACRQCGGTGIDHYSPFVYCWACDGTKKQIRTSTPRGFKNIPVKTTYDSVNKAYLILPVETTA